MKLLNLIIIVFFFSCKSNMEQSIKEIDNDSTSKKISKINYTISKDTIWGINNSPYYLDSLLTVKQDAKLSIEAGVKIIIRNITSWIKIDGTLEALGTKNLKIVINAENDNIKYIRFSKLSKNNKLYFVDLKNIDLNIDTYDISIDFCKIYNLNIWCKTNTGTESFTLKNLSIEALGVYPRNSEIKTINCKNIIFGSISNDDPINIEVEGIKNSLNLDSCTLSLSPIGIYIREENTLISNLNYFKISNCNLLNQNSNNTHYKNLVRPIWNRSMQNQNAQFNWWGTTNDSIIQAKIIDKQDSVLYGKVDYSNYLSAPVTVTGCGW